MSPDRPVTMLIAALGGEGGGVLTDWIIAAATDAGLPVQSTSIPGVAQRTGATTYYIEVFPCPWRELGGRRPVLGLSPGTGDVDIVVASEFLEAGRAVAAGFVTPDRTLVIASTHRAHAIAEKTPMGDGRFDPEKLAMAVASTARAHALFDMEETARRSGAMINAVMLGAIAACGRLPIAPNAFERAIRAGGKSVDANLRGFAAGREAAGDVPKISASASKSDRPVVVSAVAVPVQAGPAPGNNRPHAEVPIAAAPEAGGPEAEALLSEAQKFAGAADLVAEGVRRLTAYQDASYARFYLDRLGPIAAADARAGAGGRVVRETARHLALRMSYEDVIRVAQAKIAPGRVAGIVSRMGARPGEPVAIFEFLKPGVEEMCSILPPWLARPVIGFAERRGLTGRLHWGMEIRTTSISGYLRLRLLAGLRGWRPHTYRYQQEQAGIRNWLDLISKATDVSPALGLEVAACANLIKGYGDTLRRGSANFAAIEARVIRPALAGAIPVGLAVDAVASARAAALADPEGEALARCLLEIERPLGIAAE